jgi:DNA-binding Lrp family transcriptional regulator
MDSIDKNILTNLSLNSRETFSKLAKKIKISREVLQYRVKNLEKNIIKRYSSQIKINILNFQRAGCYIVLQNSSLNFQKEILKFLIKHDFINGISTNIGKYDIICDIFYKKPEELKIILEEIENFIGDRTKEIFILNIPLEPKFFFNRLLEQKEITAKSRITNNKKLDSIDLKILEILNLNSRCSLIEIGTILNIKANTIAYRIKNLQKNNIIQNSTIFINYKELNIDFYNIQIKVSKNKNHQEISNF